MTSYFKLNRSSVFICLLLLVLFVCFFLQVIEIPIFYIGLFMALSACCLLILFVQICSDFKAEIRNSQMEKFDQEFQQISSPIRLLIENPESSTAYSRLLELIAIRFDLALLAIYSFDEQTGLLSLLATNSDSDKILFPSQLSSAALHTIDQSNDEIVDISAHFKASHNYGIGLRDEEALYGLFVLSRAVGDKNETGFLLEFSKQLSKLILSSRRAQINRRQDLYQERSVIARELHDSLAQSLSYLKIQLARLQSHIDKNRQSNSSDFLPIENAIVELRTNLNLAYSQLRELMTTFRLTMNGKDLRYAIDESISEFRQRTIIVFDSDIRMSSESLNAQEELQLLQIVREAISNVVRHSQATRAKISLSIGENKVSLSVSDNGVGLASIPEPVQHHGLIIMQERTRRLNGNLQVKTPETGGTLLQISFTPTHLSNGDSS